MRELFINQEKVRYKLRLQHLTERVCQKFLIKFFWHPQVFSTHDFPRVCCMQHVSSVFYEYLYSDTSSGETDFVIGAREDPRARAGSSCDGQSEPASQCVYNIKEWRNLSCNGCRAGNISDFCHFHKKETIYAKNYTHRSIDNICTHTEITSLMFGFL